MKNNMKNPLEDSSSSSSSSSSNSKRQRTDVTVTLDETHDEEELRQDLARVSALYPTFVPKKSPAKERFITVTI